MSLPNLWKSQNLIYRACEDEDDAFILTLYENGSEALVNASLGLPVPQGKASVKRYREHLQSAFCGAIICLPPPAQDQSVESTPEAPIKAEGTPMGVSKPKPTPIGCIELNAMERGRHHRFAEIGINIAAPFQGKGYGTEAIEWAVEWGFRHANLHRIGIGAFGWNTGAIRLYERLGFVVEGRKREMIWHDGQYLDVVEMGMLEHEWRARQSVKKEACAGAVSTES